MKLASALLLVVALCHLAPPAAADPGGGAAPLDLDAEEVIAAPTPDFTIPIKVNGQEVECGYWKGQDPADVAIEFGSLHQLDGKKISRLRKAIAAEAETRGLLDTEPAPAPTQVVPAETSAPDRSRPGAHALSITRFQDKWAKMQVATIQFAHSPFCQKFCTKENGGVMGVAVAIAIINAVWAMMRYKRRKDAVKEKLARLEEEEQLRRVEQKKMFSENFSQAEATALAGAFGNQIKSIRKREAEAQKPDGASIKWGWPEWGNRRQMKD